ncbi:MAG TPA: tetratricopeptide repeat protein [Terriglobales bacterium]
MKSLAKVAHLLLFVLAFAAAAMSQGTSETRTVLVLPFENRTKSPNLEWIKETFPELIGQRLSAIGGIYVIGRDDRIYAFDRLGIPAHLRASRATLYTIAQQLDADYIVLGSYRMQDQQFTAEAELLDMKALHLSEPMHVSGQINGLIEVESQLAFQVLKAIRPQTTSTADDFMHFGQTVRIDALESYIRGITATTTKEKLQRFREAVRLNPQYSLAMLQLGRLHYNAREYDQAAQWLSKIPTTESCAGEANFLLGLSEYSLGQMDKAEAAFKVTEAKVPLTEVSNNLGVVASRKGRRDALDMFEKAALADPQDADYRFNLAVAQAHNGDAAAAIRSLRDLVARHPSDTEARQFLDSLTAHSIPISSSGSASSVRIPLPRLKRNYDESSYRQLALEVENAVEQSLANAPPTVHANYHVQRGQQLLAQGQVDEASREFHEAAQRDYNNADAHAGLARVALLRDQKFTARNEAKLALRIRRNADSLLVLAQLDAEEGHMTNAEHELQEASTMEPANPAVAEVQRLLEAKRNGTASQTEETKDAPK